jgi:hypothetical protein
MDIPDIAIGHDARIVRTAYRYQRPPRKRQAAALEVPTVVKAADAVASGNLVPTPSAIVTIRRRKCHRALL